VGVSINAKSSAAARSSRGDAQLQRFFQEKVLQYDLGRTARSTMQISMCRQLWNFTGSAEPATRCFAFNAPFTAVKLRETPPIKLRWPWSAAPFPISRTPTARTDAFFRRLRRQFL